MLRPLCKHDPEQPQAGCKGCEEWHHPVRGAGYQDAVAALHGEPGKQLKRILKIIPTKGAGTEFKKIVLSMGFKQFQGCSCESIRSEMDRMGSAWCREHVDVLVDRIHKNADKVGWYAKVKAGITAALIGEWYNPLNPIPSMIFEACRRADECNAT